MIGRNEGERLIASLRALRREVLIRRIIYVDSGSEDGSQEAARSFGAVVVALDTASGFTAARARNAGAAQLAEAADPPEFLLFIDGDCQLRPGFIAAALQAFAEEPDVVVVCGRRREINPGASVYNRLCDREWQGEAGEVLACGGDAVMRRAAFAAVGGYRAGLIAGEEPELCQRLRRRGGRILRIAAEMTWHDAAMLRFSQWWRRTKRAGYAFAEGAALHGAGPDRHWQRETRRALLQGLVLPLLIAGLALVSPWALAGLLFWPLQIARLSWRGRHEGGRAAFEAAVFTVLGKLPEALGALAFYRGRLSGRQRGLIEYK